MPNIDQNLLNVGKLMEKGFKVIFEDQWCLIKDNLGNNVLRVKMKSKGFTLNLIEEQSVFSAKTCSDELWHKRVGHFHHAVTNCGIKELDISIMQGLCICKNILL